MGYAGTITVDGRTFDVVWRKNADGTRLVPYLGGGGEGGEGIVFTLPPGAQNIEISPIGHDIEEDIAHLNAYIEAAGKSENAILADLPFRPAAGKSETTILTNLPFPAQTDHR